VDAIRESDTTRPVREYLEALDAGNPVHQGDARYLSPTDPAAAWNTKEGRGKLGYFNNYLVDTDHAVIVDVEATPARIAQEIVATKAMLRRVEEKHSLKPGAWQRAKLTPPAHSLAGCQSAKSSRTFRCVIGSIKPKACCLVSLSPLIPQRIITFVHRAKF
jgi:hypothetical protein